MKLKIMENALHSIDTKFMFWMKSGFTVFFTKGPATTLKTLMILSINVLPCSSLFSTTSGSTLLSDPWYQYCKENKNMFNWQFNSIKKWCYHSPSFLSNDVMEGYWRSLIKLKLQWKILHTRAIVCLFACFISLEFAVSFFYYPLKKAM